MKGFLLDENIPRNLTFTPALPVFHARDLGASVSDTMLWHYANEHELAIVSKDADFSNRMIVSTPPPWVVHLRFGNLRRKSFHALPARMWPTVEPLLPEHKLINVHDGRVEAVKD